jgi:hypothetical protein
MRKLTKKQKTAVVAGSLVLAMAGSGVAYAWWTTSGSGTGNGSTAPGNAAALSITGDAASPMFPGDSSQPLTVTVKNDGTENYYVSDVKAWITTDKAGCDGDDYLINDDSAPSTEGTAVSLNWTSVDLVPGDTHASSNTIQFNNKPADNQDACKGAVVTLHYSAS